MTRVGLTVKLTLLLIGAVVVTVGLVATAVLITINMNPGVLVK